MLQNVVLTLFRQFLSSRMNYLALFSPIFTYLLLNYVSGVRILEARGHKKWGHIEEYNAYKESTPKMIPKIY